MARAPRLDEPGARHLVMNRGARRQPIFLDDDGRARFLSLLAELPTRFEVRVHGYVLMPSHFQLLLECRSGGLDQAMQYLQSRYSKWLNAAMDWDGPLYRGRYRNRVVGDEPVWAHLLAFLHLEPVRALLASEAGQAAWTSHAAYVGSVPRPDWLTTSELLGLFGSVASYKDYLWEVQVGRERGPASFDPDKLWQKASRGRRPEVGGPQGRRRIGLDQAWDALHRVTGKSRTELLSRPTAGRGEPARWLAMAWLSMATGRTRASIAAEFGVGPAVVSRAAGRYRALLGTDERVTGWTDELDRLLTEVGESVPG